MVIALALIHHLAIRGNVPFDSIAKLFSTLSDSLIIEFIPKDDEKVKLLLLNRVDIFKNYTTYKFEEAFLKYFTFEEKVISQSNKREFYLMKRK